MANLGDLIDEIRDDIDRGTNYDDAIRKAIISAIEFYRATDMGFNLKQGSFVVSDRFTSLSADILAIQSLKLDLSTTWEVLQPINYLDLEGIDTQQDSTGEPIYYAIQARQLRLYPVPDQSYSLQATFVYDLPEVSASASNSASNAWVNEARELIRMQATIDVLENKVKGPEALQDAMALRQRVMEVKRRLEARAGREKRAGGITPWL